MLASLEVRAPFLDRNIVEFAFGLVPDKLKVQFGQKKILPKFLAKTLLPPEFDVHRKQGFSLPLKSWFVGKQIEDLGFQASDLDTPVFDKNRLGLMIRENVKLGNLEKVFGLLLFIHWVREYKVQFK
jgi:asparagine synthase (glutamine-hydrolysing)